MVEINWETFMGLDPEALSEREKDDIYDTVATYNPEHIAERKHFIQFIRISQQVLKLKSEQVESLNNALDEVAARQGKEEASKLRQYSEEIQVLRDELEYYRKVDRSSVKSTDASNEELRREIENLEVQIEELSGELKEKENDLIVEKKEVERYASQVAVLEREKEEMKRELKALQDEGADKAIQNLKDSPDLEAEKQEELVEMIRQKNKHINQLFEDIEAVENENTTLREKLSAIRDELSETTANMTEITSELSKFKFLNKEYENKEVDYKDRIKSLNFQIEELVNEKLKHDKQLDDYVLMFNSKVQEWKDAIESKDDEIIKIKEELKQMCIATSSYPTSDVCDNKLQKKLLLQEEQIDILQQELQKATEEINSSAELIEKLKVKQMQMIPESADKAAISFFEEKIKILEEKLVYAEEDAFAKAEEMSTLVIQLREYESNVFGLPEAVAKIKKLEKVIQKKDLQLEKLVEICNNLEIKLDNFEEQNVTLKEKLGLPVSEEVETSGITRRLKEDEQLKKNLKLQLDKKEEELIKVKIKYRKLVSYFKMFPPPSVKPISQDATECAEMEVMKNQKDLNKKLELIISENDALRKGMHEILESIREQECSGGVEVQSACLERLLEALDSRHVSGWYHPAMRLQAQLSTEEGKNDELRSQIRSLKVEERKRASELQNAYLKIQSLENDLSTAREDEEKFGVEVKEVKMVVEHAEPETEKISQTNINQERKIIELESKLHEMTLVSHGKMVDFEKRESDYAAEKEHLSTRIEELESQIKFLNDENVDPDLKKLSELTSSKIISDRKVNYLKILIDEKEETNERLRQEIINSEKRLSLDILKLQGQKSELLRNIEKLENAVLNAVPMEKFVALSKELADMRAKYQKAVTLELIKGETYKSENVSEEVNLLVGEREALLEELKRCKEKLIAAEALISEDAVTKGDVSNEISAFASRLAAAEVRELNEKQKASHMEKLNASLKAQNDELDVRNRELMEKVVGLTEDCLKYQDLERELRTKLLDRISDEDHEALLKRIEELSRNVDELTVDRDNVQELFEISQGQCRALQDWRESEKAAIASQREQILLLQTTTDDKATISRLSHELARFKLLSSELTKKNSNLDMKMTKLKGQNLSLEIKMTESRSELFQLRKKHLTQTKYLHETINDVRKLYGPAVAFRDLESIIARKTDLEEKKMKLVEDVEELRNKTRECCVKKDELETQLESLESLKTALNGDAKTLVFWHNKSTELRLKEAKHRRQAEFLAGEIMQLQTCIKKLNEEITTLERDAIEREKEWERKQLLWEESQLDMCNLLEEKGIKKEAKSFRDATVSTEISTDATESGEREKLAGGDTRVEELEAEIARLVMESKKKEEVILMKETESSRRPESVSEATSAMLVELKSEAAELEAFKVTVESLQKIIKQKEETILRYQDLLKEAREEYARAGAKLHAEIRDLNQSLVVQNRAYNKLKNAVQANRISGDNVPVVVEKYLMRIQELEDELRECQMNLSSVNTQAYTSHQELEKWRNLATERLLEIEDTKQRIRGEFKGEMESYKEEIGKYQMEVERLMGLLAAQRVESEAKDPRTGIEQIQVKSPSDNEVPKSDDFEPGFEKAGRLPKPAQICQENEALKRQLKFAKDESARLREQLRLLQVRPPKRVRSAGSSTTRSDSKLSVREGSLTSKIKHLEELLTTSREREKELMDVNLKKLKSTEEVARWEERKKSQQIIKNLSSKLKEKEAEVEVLLNKNDSYRNMVYKGERDKAILELQIKAAKGGSKGVNTKIEKLTEEKKRLETEINILHDKLEEQRRHSSRTGVALLEEKLELQERKLAAFELSSRGQNALVEEVEKLKSANSSLEKLNLRLESENLALQLKSEKEKSEICYLIDKVKHLQEAAGEVKCRDCKKSSSLLRKIEKLTEENKKLRKDVEEKKNYGCMEKLRKEFAKLREDHSSLQLKFVESLDRNASLEDEIKSYRYQIHLMEEKDFAEVLTGNFQTTAELTQEIVELRSKLDHKNQLLTRVKALLIKAAAKEKAFQEMNLIQNMFPKCVASEQAKCGNDEKPES